MSALEHFWATLARHAEERPDQAALVGSDESVTYGQLPAEIAEYGSRLKAGDCRRVALAVENGYQWILWDLACIRCNLVCVPVPPFFSAEQVRHLLDSANVDTLIGELPNGVDPTELGFTPAPLGWQRDAADAATAPPLPAHTSKITFTSGTTGRPKGVCLSADALMDVAHSLQQASAEASPQRHLVLLPLGVLLDNVGVYAALLAGASVYLPAHTGVFGSRLDIQLLMQNLHQTQPHSLILVPQLLQALLQAAAAGLHPPAGLRFIAVGGGRIAPALLEHAAQLGWPVYEGYGLSECASVVCLNHPAGHRPGSVGKALAHLRVSLAEDGEILVHGSGPLGYLGTPEAVPSPWPTGDIGYLEGGFLTVLGRKKNQFITAFGRNVNPEWIEAELTSEPAIAQAYVHGESLPCNLGLVVPSDPRTGPTELSQAIERVNASLPDYAQLHHWLVPDQPFTATNGLLTSNGRLRRAAVLEQYRQALHSLIPEESYHEFL